MRAATIALGLVQAWAAIDQVLGDSTTSAFKAASSAQQAADNALLAAGETNTHYQWDGTGAGYKCEWGEEVVQSGKQELTLVGDCEVPVRVPRDTYVGDMRVNANDELADGVRESPMIKVGVTDLKGNSQPFDYTWKGYLSDPASSLDEITFSEFGVYALTMTASDYKGSATCDGCVAVVDTYPPHAKEPCQTTDFGTTLTSTDLTTTNLEEANKKEAAFHAFSSAGNIKNNLPNQLANDEVRKLTDFFESNEKNIDDSLDYCFDSDIIKDLLGKGASKVNPLSTKSETELSNLVCKRCCNKKTELKEKFVDYKCGQTVFQTLQSVSGGSCSFKHCMSIGSLTLVETTASVVSGVNSNAVATIATGDLYTKDTNAMIHRLSMCTTGISTPACSRSETLSALIDIDSTWKTTIPGTSFSNEDYDVEEYVFWRYRINTDAWNLWSDTASYSFKDTKTDITLEAWTACGKVAEFKFTYALYASADICSGFTAMFTKTDLSKTDKDGAICTYQQGDFAPVLFSIPAGTSVSDCTIKVAPGTTTAFTSISDTSLALTTYDSQVYAYFGIALTTDGVHKDTKNVEVSCSVRSGTATQTCSTTFKVKECNEGANGDGTCSVADCSVANHLGKNDVCGGTIYQATTDQKTQVKPAGQCCPSCDKNKKQLACSTVKNSPTTDDGPFQTCVVSGAVALSQDNGADTSLAAFAVGVASGSALLGLVALIVFKRRAQFTVNSKDDAYYALLE